MGTQTARGLADKVRAVIFDLDETLIDSLQGHVGAHAEVCRVLGEFLRGEGYPVDEKELLTQISKLDDEMNKQFIYDRDEWWPRLLERMMIQARLPEDLVKKLTRSYWLAYASSAKPYPETLPILKYLKDRGYLLGLLSDTDRLPGMKRYRIEIQPFRDLFHITLVSGEETEQTKPSPEPFLAAAEKLGVRPEECVFVGDKPFADIEGAKKAGMRTVLVYRRDWGVKVEADYVVRSLDELRRIL
ncbi:HAD-IA family hydrolase [Candidatus Bathyarchaeota archaeon]|nr:HAD-IA family hydrolase [Candidatus Bathyarchaeota archaeon]